MVDNSSIGQLYAGAFLPGFLLSGLYILYITIRCYINPKMGPPVPKEERLDWAGLFKVAAADRPGHDSDLPGPGDDHPRGRVPDGGGGRGMPRGLDHRRSSRGACPGRTTGQAAENTIKATGMVMWTMFGANIFIALYIMVGGGDFVNAMLLGSGLSKWAVIWIMMGILIFLGCFIDWVGIIMLSVPLFGPIIRTAGVRSDLVRRPVRREPADVLPDAALRHVALLPQERGAAGGLHRGRLEIGCSLSGPCSSSAWCCACTSRTSFSGRPSISSGAELTG